MPFYIVSLKQALTIVHTSDELQFFCFINHIRFNLDEYNHNENQILKARVSHMIRFIWLKTDEYNHNDDRILKARVVI